MTASSRDIELANAIHWYVSEVCEDFCEKSVRLNVRMWRDWLDRLGVPTILPKSASIPNELRNSVIIVPQVDISLLSTWLAEEFMSETDSSSTVPLFLNFSCDNEFNYALSPEFSADGYVEISLPKLPAHVDCDAFYVPPQVNGNYCVADITKTSQPLSTEEVCLAALSDSDYPLATRTPQDFGRLFLVRKEIYTEKDNGKRYYSGCNEAAEVICAYYKAYGK